MLCGLILTDLTWQPKSTVGSNPTKCDSLTVITIVLLPVGLFLQMYCKSYLSGNKKMTNWYSKLQTVQARHIHIRKHLQHAIRALRETWKPTALLPCCRSLNDSVFKQLLRFPVNTNLVSCLRRQHLPNVCLLSWSAVCWVAGYEERPHKSPWQ